MTLLTFKRFMKICNAFKVPSNFVFINLMYETNKKNSTYKIMNRYLGNTS